MAAQSVQDAIIAGAQAHSVSPETMLAIARIESNNNPNATNPSGAAGLFQFMPGTARQYGLTNPMDAVASSNAAAALTAANTQRLANALGRQPTPGEIYLAHQQGVSGAIALIENPDAPASSLVNFQAIYQNLPRNMQAQARTMTASQFASYWGGKIDNAISTIPPGSIPESANSSASADTSTIPPLPRSRPADSLGISGAGEQLAFNPTAPIRGTPTLGDDGQVYRATGSIPSMDAGYDATTGTIRPFANNADILSAMGSGSTVTGSGPTWASLLGTSSNSDPGDLVSLAHSMGTPYSSTSDVASFSPTGPVPLAPVLKNASGSPDDRDSGAYPASTAPLPLSDPRLAPVTPQAPPAGYGAAATQTAAPAAAPQQTMTINGHTYVVGNHYTLGDGTVFQATPTGFTKIANPVGNPTPLQIYLAAQNPVNMANLNYTKDAALGTLKGLGNVASTTFDNLKDDFVNSVIGSKIAGASGQVGGIASGATSALSSALGNLFGSGKAQTATSQPATSGSSTLTEAQRNAILGTGTPVSVPQSSGPAGGYYSTSSVPQSSGPAGGYYSTPYSGGSTGGSGGIASYGGYIPGANSGSNPYDSLSSADPFDLATAGVPTSAAPPTTYNFVSVPNPAYEAALKDLTAYTPIPGQGDVVSLPTAPTALPPKTILRRIAVMHAATPAPAAPVPVAPPTLAQQYAAMTPAQRASQNPAAATALLNNQTSYQVGNVTMPTVAMDGSIRNTYGDTPGTSLQSGGATSVHQQSWGDSMGFAKGGIVYRG